MRQNINNLYTDWTLGVDMNTRALSLIFILLSACSLPRGSALQSEILANSGTEPAEFSVHSVTREQLPIYANWPSDKTSSYDWPSHRHQNAVVTIAPYDVLSVQIWDNSDVSLLTSPATKNTRLDNVTVGADGKIFIPYVGHISVANKSIEHARSHIQTEIERVIPSAQVIVESTGGTRSAVDVTGAVANPGSHKITDPHFSVLNALSASGGVTNTDSNPQVRLVRGGKTHQTALENIHETPSMNTILRGGDTIIIKDDDRFFRALGASQTETIVPFNKETITALDAMSMIGGLQDSRANPQGILVLREYDANQVRDGIAGPKHERTVFSIDLTNADGLFSAGAFEIKSEDTVVVTESPLTALQTILGAVGVVQNIAN